MKISESLSKIFLNVYLASLSRIIVGVVFIFSGIVKAIDPLGSVYKFNDYFNDAFGLPQLQTISFALAVIANSAEFLVGICLFFNVKPKLSALGALLFMIIFTPLTFYLAVANPVHDCGCFGDAVIMSNWETFYKNLIITLFVVIYFLYRKKAKPIITEKLQWILASIFLLLILGFQHYNYNHLPVIDFRPYKVGTYIPEKMKLPEGAKQDVFETSLIYKNQNTGEVKKFTMNNYPWQDSTWIWVETKTVLLQKGDQPEIHDFVIVNSDNQDITDIVLLDEKPSFLYISYQIDKADVDGFNDAKQIFDYSLHNDFNFYILTASNDIDIIKLSEKLSYKPNFYKVDEITLKTIIRANPGLVLLQKGKIMGKWHHNDLPEIEKIEKIIKRK